MKSPLIIVLFTLALVGLIDARQKRDLARLANFFYNKIFGSTLRDTIFVSPELSISQPVENYEIFRIPGHENILIKAIPKMEINTNVNIENKEDHYIKKTAMPVIDGTKEVNKLIQTEIINDAQELKETDFIVSTVSKPTQVTYKNNGYSHQLLAERVRINDETINPIPIYNPIIEIPAIAPAPPVEIGVPILPQPEIIIEENLEIQKPLVDYPSVAIPTYFSTILTNPIKYSYSQESKGKTQTYNLDKNMDVVVTETKKPMPPPPVYLQDRLQEVLLCSPLGLQSLPLSPVSAVHTYPFNDIISPPAFADKGVVEVNKYILQHPEDRMKITNTGKYKGTDNFIEPKKESINSSTDKKSSQNTQNSVYFTEPVVSKYVYKQINHNTPNKFVVVNVEDPPKPNQIKIDPNLHTSQVVKDKDHVTVSLTKATQSLTLSKVDTNLDITTETAQKTGYSFKIGLNNIQKSTNKLPDSTSPSVYSGLKDDAYTYSSNPYDDKKKLVSESSTVLNVPAGYVFMPPLTTEMPPPIEKLNDNPDIKTHYSYKLQTNSNKRKPSESLAEYSDASQAVLRSETNQIIKPTAPKELEDNISFISHPIIVPDESYTYGQNVIGTTNLEQNFRGDMPELY